MQRIIGIFIVMMLTLTVGTSAVFADSILISTSSDNHTFSRKWDGTPIKKNHSTLCYGFNTSFINEDYAYADSYGYGHRSKIKNANGLHYGPKKWANEGYSDVEVRHKGSKIYYYCMNIT